MADPETVDEQLADKVGITRVAIWQLCRRYEGQGLEAIFIQKSPKTFGPSSA
jgi:hypothetical protein